jgi:hypothetical protein
LCTCKYLHCALCLCNLLVNVPGNRTGITRRVEPCHKLALVFCLANGTGHRTGIPRRVDPCHAGIDHAEDGFFSANGPEAPAANLQTGSTSMGWECPLPGPTACSVFCLCIQCVCSVRYANMQSFENPCRARGARCPQTARGGTHSPRAVKKRHVACMHGS